MIPREALINALRLLEFIPKRGTDRVEIYKHTRSTLRVAVPCRELLDEAYVRLLLRQAGMKLADIERFISDTRTLRH